MEEKENPLTKYYPKQPTRLERAKERFNDEGLIPAICVILNTDRLTLFETFCYISILVAGTMYFIVMILLTITLFRSGI